jgi:hypothetical protein
MQTLAENFEFSRGNHFLIPNPAIPAHFFGRTENGL